MGEVVQVGGVIIRRERGRNIYYYEYKKRRVGGFPKPFLKMVLNHDDCWGKRKLVRKYMNFYFSKRKYKLVFFIC